MSAGFNKILLLGYLATEPDLRYTPNGSPVCNFRLAVNKKSKNPETGELKDNNVFVRVVSWGSLAENCAKYLDKGKMAFVEGSLQQRSWEDKDGKQVTILEIKAVNIQFLSSRKESDNNTNNFSEDNLPF